MNRTIVCTKCDNNKVIIEKIGPQLYIKCSKCDNTIMKTLHLESWNKSATNTYKLRISMEDDSLMEADIIETTENKLEWQNLNKEELKIRLMYVKEYDYIRQLGKDEYIDMRSIDITA
jgi:phage FluMu protein Com